MDKIYKGKPYNDKYYYDRNTNQWELAKGVTNHFLHNDYRKHKDVHYSQVLDAIKTLEKKFVYDFYFEILELFINTQNRSVYQHIIENYWCDSDFETQFNTYQFITRNDKEIKILIKFKEYPNNYIEGFHNKLNYCESIEYTIKMQNEPKSEFIWETNIIEIFENKVKIFGADKWYLSHRPKGNVIERDKLYLLLNAITEFKHFKRIK